MHHGIAWIRGLDDMDWRTCPGFFLVTRQQIIMALTGSHFGFS
jgi:hypothetical protein